MDAEYYKKYEPVFGKWYITKQLGAGSYGKVFEIQRTDARDVTVYRVALKAITIPSSPEELQSVLDEDGLDRQGASSYFRETVVALNREIALMNKVKGHSNIVSYEDHDVIEHTDGIGWDILIRMELLTPISQYFKQFDTIPRQAVLENQGKSFVYVIAQDSRARMVPVATGPAVGSDRIAVISGITPESLVIYDGMAHIRQGMAVTNTAQ